VRHPGDGLQGLEEHVVIAIRLDPTHHRGIVRSRRFEHVGNRDQADIETLLHLLQLSFDRLLFGAGGFNARLRPKHVEIGGGDPNDQVAFSIRKVMFRLDRQRLGSTEIEPARRIEDGLSKLRIPPVAIGGLGRHCKDLPEARAVRIEVEA